MTALGRAGPALAVLLAGLPPGSPGTERDPFPRQVEEGATLRRSFRSVSRLTLEGLELTIDGEPHPAGPSDLEVEIEKRRLVVVEDDFGPPAGPSPGSGGRPRVLVRHFEELGGHDGRRVSGADGDSAVEREVESALEGCSVRFALGPDDRGEHVASWAEGACDEALLERLGEDMDLRVFLPEPGRELEPGDTWEVAPGAYLALVAPGGVELHASGATEVDRRVATELREHLEGDIRATYQGWRAGDGGEVSVVALEVSVATRAASPVPTDDEARVRVVVSYAHELEGELLWSVEGGHLVSLELSGRSELVERTLIEVGGQEREQTTRFAGRSTHAVSVERVD